MVRCLSPGHIFLFLILHLTNCVKVFNNAGVHQYDIGCEGSGDDQLKFSIGFAIDKINHLGHPCGSPIFGHLD